VAPGQKSPGETLARSADGDEAQLLAGVHRAQAGIVPDSSRLPRTLINNTFVGPGVPEL
jgi:hypothetical protein